jgi:TRAP-type mannitol/chloroaromatic compound transport system substrate-binding protein
MYNASEKLLKEASESNEQAARIIKSQEDYLARSRAYTEISERAYLNTMGTVE